MYSDSWFQLKVTLDFHWSRPSWQREYNVCGRTKLFTSLKEGERRKKEKRVRGEKEEEREKGEKEHGDNNYPSKV